MFAYNVEGLPTNRPVVWSQAPILPLAPGVLTPFSYSVLAEIIGRAWYKYYDSVGFNPQPRARVLQRHRGRIYQNVSISARLESEHAGIEPLTFLMNGASFRVSEWEKPGLLGAFKNGRAQRKLVEQVEILAGQVDTVTTNGRRWLTKTAEIRWTQAEILQVMEEIERVSLDSLMFFVAVRHALYGAYNQLARLTADPMSLQSLNAINHAVGNVDGLTENRIAVAVIDLAAATTLHDDVRSWLQLSDLSDWRTTCPSETLIEDMDRFLADFGHRCADEGEIANPRWSENPTPIFHAVLACLLHNPKNSATLPVDQHVDKLMTHIDRNRQQAAQAHLQQIRTLLRYQSRALNAVAYFLAGTRNWAHAAGREAANDGRLSSPDDVFYFELEEVKQMMTGEWNVSDIDGIRTTAEKRKEAFMEWQTELPGDLLLDEIEATSAYDGLPGTAGHVTGPLRRWDHPQPQVCNGAVVGVPVLDSGWSLLLPIAHGLLSATGTPIDPIVAAARQWHTPIITGLGAKYAQLVEGAQTTIDVETMLVDQ